MYIEPYQPGLDGQSVSVFVRSSWKKICPCPCKKIHVRPTLFHNFQNFLEPKLSRTFPQLPQRCINKNANKQLQLIKGRLQTVSLLPKKSNNRVCSHRTVAIIDTPCPFSNKKAHFELALLCRAVCAKTAKKKSMRI
jgi:hypothetical protein